VLSVLAAAVVGVSVAWACTTGADMKLENTTSPDQGKNYTTCVPPAYPTACTRSVKVTGTGFVNSAANTTVGSVDLYWIDEPFLAAGLGLQGPEEQVSAELCKATGKKVATAVPVSGGSFSTTVDIPPAGHVAFYGSNAVCAVWTHTLANGSRHDSGLGNTYNIWPF
jgi:hypothetical protein